MTASRDLAIRTAGPCPRCLLEQLVVWRLTVESGAIAGGIRLRVTEFTSCGCGFVPFVARDPR